MPKRSNKFQKIIHLIHCQILGSKVIESAMFRDSRTNMEREVDIAIITEIADYQVIVGIECRDHKRPQSIGWVEEMSAKHTALPTNSLILVSSSGFYKPAIEAAKKLNIKTLSLEEAEQCNWEDELSTIDKFRITQIWKGLVRCTVIPDEAWFPREMGQVTLSKLKAFSAKTTYLGTLSEIVEKYIDAIELPKEHGINSGDNNKFILDCGIKFGKGSYLIDEDKLPRLLKEIVFRLEIEVFVSVNSTNTYKFNKTSFKLAETNDNADVIYTAIKNGDNTYCYGASVVEITRKRVPCSWDMAIDDMYLSEDGDGIETYLNYNEDQPLSTSSSDTPEIRKISLECGFSGKAKLDD